MKKINIIVVVLLCTSLWQLSSASWIHVKAIIAQQLLNHSWNLTMDDSGKNKYKPWSWADTWPVAKMTVPKHHVEQIILAGDSGSSLAFAPGYSLASALPNSAGTTVISAHRDTHFKFLKELKINEIILMQTPDDTITYQIHDIQIVDSKSFRIQPDKEEQSLILVTCYPFEGLTSGGSLRYLVYASEVTEETKIKLQET